MLHQEPALATASLEAPPLHGHWFVRSNLKTYENTDDDDRKVDANSEPVLIFDMFSDAGK
jgi:hypothetical protein